MKNSIATGMLALSLLSSAAWAIDAREEKGMRYVSGGIGEEELNEIEAMQSQFNLKVVMAMKTGEYVSDEPVAIRDAAGHELITAAADGPLFYVRLPAGNYEVAAGSQKPRRVTVKDTGLTEVHFRW